MKITATIITLNEERNIARAIESLRCCDEILIVDSGSTDRTVELAENLGARVIEANWRGYAGAEELGRRAGHATIGFSRSTPTKRSAKRWKPKSGTSRRPARASTPTPCRAWRATWAAGSCIRGWYPDRKVRLYDRRKASWVGDFVHESVQVRRAAWDTSKATSCTSPATRSPSTSRPWTATPRWPPRNWPRAR